MIVGGGDIVSGKEFRIVDINLWIEFYGVFKVVDGFVIVF